MTSIEKALAVKHFTTIYTFESIRNDKQKAEQAKGALDMLLCIEAITPERCAILRAVLKAITRDTNTKGEQNERNRKITQR